MKQLNQREKIAVWIGAGAVAVFVVLHFLVFPLTDGRARLTKRLSAQEKALAEMRVLQEQYQNIAQRSGTLSTQLAEREPGFSLFSFLEQNAAENEVKEHIAYMKPSEPLENDQFKQSQVEMKLQGVTLKKLILFLKQVESPRHLVGIDKVTIQDNTKEQGTLDVTLQMVSIDQAKEAASH
jgi:general secretion pathway protein M